jgi:hypothetical protein
VRDLEHTEPISFGQAGVEQCTDMAHRLGRAGEHLHGIITQATAYDTGLNVSGDTRPDKLRHAILQAAIAGKGSYPPDATVVNPSDVEAIELIKDSAATVGNYDVGDPTGSGSIAFTTLWRLPVVESFSISAGTFLAGPFATGAEPVDRMEATVDISYETGDAFIKNLAIVRCELREALAVRTPANFILGAY